MNPKEVFLKLPGSNDYIESIDKPAFKEALLYVLDHFRRNLSTRDDPGANWHRMEGAEMFINAMFDIAELPKPRSIPAKRLKSHTQVPYAETHIQRSD